MTEGCECLPSPKTEERIWRRAAAHLAHVHLMGVFARRGAICGEDGCAVAIGVLVDQTDGVIQGVCLQNNKHRSKDLFGVALHLRL